MPILAIYHGKNGDYSLYEVNNGFRNIRILHDSNRVWVIVKDNIKGQILAENMKFVRSGYSLMNIPRSSLVSPATGEGRYNILSATRYPIVTIVRGPSLLQNYHPITPNELSTAPELWIEPFPSMPAKP